MTQNADGKGDSSRSGAAAETRVLLVRHGETEYNRTDRYMGRREDGLNDAGRTQAERLARRLAAGPPPAALYTSPLARTRETAGFLEAALGIPATPEPGFLEIDMGPWEGRVRAEVAAEDPERWQLWLRDPSRVHVEGLENVAEVRQRVGEALDRVVALHRGERIVVVTHFAAVAVALLHALDLPTSAYRRFPVANCSLTILRCGPFNKLVCFNDTSHLYLMPGTDTR